MQEMVLGEATAPFMPMYISASESALRVPESASHRAANDMERLNYWHFLFHPLSVELRSVFRGGTDVTQVVKWWAEF